MKFGEAIEALKTGKPIFRMAWNAAGPKRWIRLYQPDFISLSTENSPSLYPAGVLPPFVESLPVLPSIEGWGASHSDLLAEDWLVGLP